MMILNSIKEYSATCLHNIQYNSKDYLLINNLIT